ncbi:MAG: hypothetical protein ABI479_09305 [Gallionella sp.]
MQKAQAIGCDNGLIGALGQMRKSLHAFFFTSLESKHQVVIMYFGRASDSLLMTSERMVVPGEVYTLEQLLNRLRERGDRWADELDDKHVMCTINGKNAALSGHVEAGNEICVYSRKSIFEP